jgi:hypothetical protein
MVFMQDGSSPQVNVVNKEVSAEGSSRLVKDTICKCLLSV